MLQVSEFVDQPQPRVNLDQRFYPGKGAEHDMARDQPVQPVKILFRHEVVENVNFHRENPSGSNVAISQSLFFGTIIWQAIICNLVLKY
ncbi:MAG: hypothetical protein WBD11_13815 [Xanthobacteraceae bacterium]